MKIPCENCIMLGMCKAKIFEVFPVGPVFMYESILWGILKCGLITSYIYYDYKMEKKVFDSRVDKWKKKFSIQKINMLPLSDGREFVENDLFTK